RHIKYQDAFDLKNVVHTEYNIEGNPNVKFVDMVLKVKPTQVTLVPDADDALTSNAGWDTITYASFLREIIQEFKNNNIRTSIFVNPEIDMIKGALKTNTDRIELYTEPFAHLYNSDPKLSIEPYKKAALVAQDLGIGVNAGHDLSLNNIQFFKQQIPNLLEVSIGHALIVESLYLGFDNVINMYLNKLKN
ncbi:MAG TPA: pyridoxine 5'-phosphate synthase, partial [Flavobacterium sp.]|nr:pyridoxine 5'-phosphate synthase [Flavobacterium sp.]